LEVEIHIQIKFKSKETHEMADFASQLLISDKQVNTWSETTLVTKMSAEEFDSVFI
jgi:hypothetical protein